MNGQRRYVVTAYHVSTLWSAATSVLAPFCDLVLFLQQPTIDNDTGTKNNLVTVRKSDCDVFEALKVDDTTPPGKSVCVCACVFVRVYVRVVMRAVVRTCMHACVHA